MKIRKYIRFVFLMIGIFSIHTLAYALPCSTSELDSTNLSATGSCSIISNGNWKSRSNAPLFSQGVSIPLENDWNAKNFDDSYWNLVRAPYPTSPQMNLFDENGEYYSNKDPNHIFNTAEAMWDDPNGVSNGSNGAVDAYFRYEFYLDFQAGNGITGISSQIWANADDDYELFINGNSYFISENSNAGDVDLVDFIDLSCEIDNINGTCNILNQNNIPTQELFFTGKNVIAVHAVDGVWGNSFNRGYERFILGANIQVSTVDEPNAFLLLGAGIIGLIIRKKKIK